MTSTPRIAVLIPCHNEDATIAQVVADFRQALPEAAIYVYDNCSTDATAAVARAAGATVRTEPRKGKGYVVRSMMRDVEADCYLLVDGDNTYPACHAPALCAEVLAPQPCDMVIGDRLSTSYFTENKRPLHGAGNRLVRWLINRLFHSHIHDIMTGYRAMSRRFVKNMPLLSQGFEVETEMTIHALENNFRISEMPIDYRDRPQGSVSKLSTMTDGFKVICTIVRLFCDYRPLAFFSVVALCLALLAGVLVVPVFIDYLHTGLVPRFPTLIVACFIMLMAMLFFIGGLILQVLVRQNRQHYELWVKSR